MRSRRVSEASTRKQSDWRHAHPGCASGKQLRITRVGILWNPARAHPEFWQNHLAAQALGVSRSNPWRLDAPRTSNTAFQPAGRERGEALIVVSSGLTSLQSQRIVDFTAKRRVPMAGAS